jgi:IS4 transposase
MAYVFRRLYSRTVDRTTGLVCDQAVRTAGVHSATDYPDKIRRIKVIDPETGKTLVFLTNNFALSAQTIADLYRCRWQVELFFKWIKQNLRIKRFFGTSENAVRTQIWIAVSVYVLIAIIKKRLRLEPSLYTLLQVLSVTALEKIPLLQAFTEAERTPPRPQERNQLNLFD